MKDAPVDEHEEIEVALISLIFLEDPEELGSREQDVSEFEIEYWLTALFHEALLRNTLLKELLEVVIRFDLKH